MLRKRFTLPNFLRPAIWHAVTPEEGADPGSAAPVEPVAPQATPPPALDTPDEGGSILDEISKFNESVEPDPDDAVLDTDDGQEDGEEGGEPDDTQIEGQTDESAVPAITFEDSDDVAAVIEKGKTLKDQFEFDPAVNAYIETLEARAQSAVNPLADLPVSTETATKIVKAFDGLLEPVDVNGTLLPNNPASVVKLLREDYPNEYVPVAAALLASDSMKYQGNSLLEELVIDTYGANKAGNALAYLSADVPLPVIPQGAALPAGLTDTVKEAYLQLPEIKRFEIEGLIGEVSNLRERLSDATEYTRPDLEKELGEKDQKLKVELKSVEDAQFRINQDREQKARAERQQKEQITAFVNKVNTEYNTEIFALADTFVNDLAPRLTFADASAQTALARDVQTRVLNALSFQILDNGTYAPEPMADYYAGQLKEEGVKFDFDKGRDLLKQHHLVTARLIQAKDTPGISKQAIEKLEAQKRNVMNEIKVNQVDLLGQITRRYVKSTTKALEEKVTEQAKKKQGARPRITGNGAGVGTGNPKPTADAIKEYNRRLRRAENEDPGTQLFKQNAVPQ